MEPEICTKMLRNLSENRTAKFPWTTLSYSMVKIARLKGALSEIFELEASPVEGQSLPQIRKGEKKFKKSQKVTFLSKKFDFCACPRKKMHFRQKAWDTDDYSGNL